MGLMGEMGNMGWMGNVGNMGNVGGRHKNKSRDALTGTRPDNLFYKVLCSVMLCKITSERTFYHSL